MRTSRYPRRGAPHLRLRIGFVLIAMVLSVFGARLVQLQGIDPGSYAAMAAAESMQDVVLPATRGDILLVQKKLPEARAAYKLALDKADSRDATLKQSVQQRLDAIGAGS